MPGLERTRVPRDQMNPDLVCQQCRNIMINPVICMKSKIRCCVECTSDICNKNSNFQHYFSQIDQELKKQVNELFVKCKYNLQGCLKMTRFKDIEAHEKQCEFAKMACDRQACISNQKTTKTTNHLVDCPFAIIVCEKCQKQMKRIEQVNHDCAKWLLSIIENLNIQNDIQSEEIAELHEKGSSIKLELQDVKRNDQKIISELEKKNHFYQMFSEDFVANIENNRVNLFQGVQQNTKDVLENTDIQVRKNQSFIDYVKSLNDLSLSHIQKVNSLLKDYSNKIEVNYVEKQVNLNLLNSQLSPVRELSEQANERESPKRQQPKNEKDSPKKQGSFRKADSIKKQGSIRQTNSPRRQISSFRSK